MIYIHLHMSDHPSLLNACAHCALQSIASKNNVNVQLIVAEEQQLVIKPEKNLCDDIYDIQQKMHKTLQDLLLAVGIRRWQRCKSTK